MHNLFQYDLNHSRPVIDVKHHPLLSEAAMLKPQGKLTQLIGQTNSHKYLPNYSWSGQTLLQFQSSQSPEMNPIVLKKASTTELFKALDEKCRNVYERMAKEKCSRSSL